MITQAFKNKKVQLWSRRLHVYISMALLLVVLFFAITGITLNRPHLFVADEPAIEQRTLQIPQQLLNAKIDKSALLHYLSKQGQLSGSPSPMDIYRDVENGELIEGEITLNYKGPGFNSTVFIDMVSQQADIETSHYGVIAVLNDLHKGRHSGQVWAWFIDISALLMVLFVLTGVCLLVPKKKSFRTGLKWTTLGSLVSFAVYLFTVP